MGMGNVCQMMRSSQPFRKAAIPNPNEGCGESEIGSQEDVTGNKNEIKKAKITRGKKS